MLEGIFVIVLLNSWTPELFLSAEAGVPAAFSQSLSSKLLTSSKVEGSKSKLEFFQLATHIASSVQTESQSPLQQTQSKPVTTTSTSQQWLWVLWAMAGGLGIGISAYWFGRASVSSSISKDTASLGSRNSSVPQSKMQASATSAPLSRTSNSPSASPENTQMTTISTVEMLVETLRNRDPRKRRQAIWELGQRGTSEAIAPLVSLMATVDSQQRSLILGTISEIGIRTIQPLNRALVLSLQDNNPDVRKNAIRDMTRLYGLMTQISQILCHATADENEDVRTTAHWALGQFNQMYRTSSTMTSIEPSVQPAPLQPSTQRPTSLR